MISGNHFYLPLNKPLTIYPGSIERIDFGEEKDPKGFIELEVNKNKHGRISFESNYKFIKTPARRFLTINIKVKENVNPTKEIISKIKKEKIDDAIVKINIKHHYNQTEALENSKIQKAQSKAHVVAGINTEIIDMLKTEQVVFYKEDSSWQDLLNEYLSKQKISKGRSQKLTEAAQDLAEELEGNL